MGHPLTRLLPVNFHEAIELGVKHFDTAEIYGFQSVVTLLGDAFAGKRDSCCRN